MTIRGKELTADQEKWYKKIMVLIQDEVNQIPSYTERVRAAKNSFVLNDREANRPYRLLEKKYMPMITTVLEESKNGDGKALTDEQRKKIDDLYAQWIEEAKQLPEPEYKPNVLDGGPSGPYDELTKKYKTLIHEVIESGQDGASHA